MLIVAIVSAAVVGLATLVYAVRHAAKGREDAEGFHSEGDAEAGTAAAPTKAFRGKKAY